MSLSRRESMIVLCWFLGEAKVMGWLLLIACGVAAVDGVVQKNQIGAGQWNHWSLVPVVGGIGAGLIGWLDGLI